MEVEEADTRTWREAYPAGAKPAELLAGQRRKWKQDGIAAEPVGEIETVELSGVPFAHSRERLALSTMPLMQETYLSFWMGHLVEFRLTYKSEEEGRQLQEALNALVLKRPAYGS